MSGDISKVAALMRNSPTLGDDEIYRILVAGGVKRERAARLVELVPTAYSRLIFRDCGARFSDKYQRKLRDGTISAEQLLSQEPVWNEAVAFALEEAQSGVSGQDLMAVAQRSPEFRAVNHLLNQGSKLENIRLTALGLLWSESGPDPV